MKMYAISLGVGLLVGAAYALLHVRSPAPPLVALVGLLGILAGEQAVPLAKHMLGGASLEKALKQADRVSHMFDTPPGEPKPPSWWDA